MKQTKDVDNLFKAILSLKTTEECYRFFEDICTNREVLDIAQRLKAADMLRDGKNYAEVYAETGMSTATISRVSKSFERGQGGYNLVLERIKNEQ